MASITTRAGKGSALTNAELDANFTNLNAEITPNRPTIRPSLLLDFANVRALDPRITFTRASTATYYDGKTVAKAEQNLLLYSQEFDNAAWAKANTTVTANSTVAPDGTTTADLLTVAGGLVVQPQCYQSVTTTAAATTFSAYIKAGNHRYYQIRFGVGSISGGSGYANFDVGGSGAVGTIGAGISSASIVSVGNGWFRCIITGTTLAAAGNQGIYVVSGLTAASAESWTPSETVTGYLWGAQLEQRSAVTAYTPTTTQPITNYIPVLQTAAANVARFNHNPTTGESLGLLIEEQRTNLLTYSEQFDNAAWTKTRCSVTANSITSPDGTLDADKLVEDTTASSTHDLTVSQSFTSGVTYTFSFYAKGSERNVRLYFPLSIFGTSYSTVFNLENGTASAVVTGSVFEIKPVGNDWYRCSMTQTATATGNSGFTVRLVQGASTSSYTGDGYSGIFIWGAQLEAGAFPTSYIPTTSAQVTRSADVAVMTGANFSSWYNAGEGTLFGEFSLAAATGKISFAASIDNGTLNNFISLARITGTGGSARIADGGVTQSDVSLGSFTSNSTYKVSTAYKANDFASSVNGEAAGTDTSGTVPVVSQLVLGNVAADNTLRMNGYLRRIAYYPKRLTNTELQGLTS